MARYITRLPDSAWQKLRPRSLVILGSTGSIGRSTLDVVARQPDTFRLIALAGARNMTLLAEQANAFRPPHLGVLDEAAAAILFSLLTPGYHPAIAVGQEGYEFLAALPEASTVLSAQVGAAGLRATVAAARAGKVIALANKESLVLAGDLIRAECAASGAAILPVDSEHNAIFQCLAGDDPTQVSRLILTASGGPFQGKSCTDLEKVTVDSALAHPNWSMGAKITIDSATLMNKGLEVIEAQHLYGMPLSAIDVVVHKESIIHSLVEYADGSQLAHLSNPDMRIAIAHCLGWPARMQTGVPVLNLARVGSLTFTEPDCKAFPCLALARIAQERGQGAPVVLNAANEMAVAAFLEGRVSFTGIAATVAHVLEEYAAHCEAAASGSFVAYEFETAPQPVFPAFTQSVPAILALDDAARGSTERYIRVMPAAS